ncbi:hypothetical protein [Bradyrhizobium sp. RT9a]|uniref:hypothetical protein n=1 Tax=Bradyrhizobium sp. RT9a TaxID=3156384 RepID=UPI0033912967
MKRLAKLLDITVQAASQAAEQLVERKILVDGPAMPATAYSLFLMRYGYQPSVSEDPILPNLPS